MRELIIEHDRRKEEIRRRLEDFTNIKDSGRIFYELCFCLLTPQSRARICWNSILALKARNFLNNNIHPKNFLDGVRFNNNKSRYLLEAKKKFSSVHHEIKTSKNNHELREWLVKNINGLGYKESGHFLRNIGFRDLAILDRHILKNLKRYDIIEEIPKALTRQKYLEIENKFKDFSKNIGISMDELDLLFWSMETGEVFK